MNKKDKTIIILIILVITFLSFFFFFNAFKIIKYKQGNPHFWKKEHQIKIFANEFEPIGFAVIHKNEALHELSNELRTGLLSSGKNVDTHKYYWEGRHIKRDN